VEAAQGVQVAELEADNTKLLVELEQTHLALAKADFALNLLSMSHVELEKNCARLHATVDMLKQEKAQIVTDREAEVTVGHFFEIIALVTARGFASFT
jgi:hypothetical protein